MRELDVMQTAIMEAAKIVGSGDREAKTKANPHGVFDVVTESDVSAENVIIDRIRSEFPEDTIISEETNPDARISGRSWAIDPIDGTMNFSRGIPLYGIQAVFLEGGVPKAASIYLPEFGEMFSASEDGAFLNGKPIAVASARPLSQCLISTGDYSRKSDAFRKAQAAVLSECYGSVARFKMFGAACVDFSYLASGRTDAHIRFTNKIWDFLPGLFIAEKAGAVYDRHLLDDHRILIMCSSPEVLAEAKAEILPAILSAMGL